MDGFGICVLFNTISVILGRWKRKREELCAVKRRFDSGKNLAYSGIRTRDPVIGSRERLPLGHAKNKTIII